MGSSQNMKNCSGLTNREFKLRNIIMLVHFGNVTNVVLSHFLTFLSVIWMLICDELS